MLKPNSINQPLEFYGQAGGAVSRAQLTRAADAILEAAGLEQPTYVEDSTDIPFVPAGTISLVYGDEKVAEGEPVQPDIPSPYSATWADEILATLRDGRRSHFDAAGLYDRADRTHDLADYMDGFSIVELRP